MAVNVTSSGGIYIEISGDYSHLRQDLNAVRSLAKAEGKAISDALSGAMDPKGASRYAETLIKTFDQAGRAAKAMSADLSGSYGKFEQMGRAIGVAEQSLGRFAGTVERAFQNKSAEMFTSSLRQIQRQTGMSNAEMNSLSKSLGGVGNEFTKAARGASSFGSCLKDIALQYGALYLSAQAFKDAGAAIGQATLQVDKLNKSYTTIYDSSAAAVQQLEYVYGVSNKLGLQFQSTAADAKTFFAAGKGTSLEGSLNKIFESVSSAGAALALSKDEMQGIFLALGQMMSKGKVQAEELRGQLGERLPGAFQLAAKAMNMTTAELDKFMADGKLAADELLPKLAVELDKAFGEKGVAAAKGLQGQLNILSTEWERFKGTLANSEDMASAVGGVAQSMKVLADNAPAIGSAIKDVTVPLAAGTAAWGAYKFALEGTGSGAAKVVANELATRNALVQSAKAKLDAAVLDQASVAWKTRQIDLIAKHNIGTVLEERAVAALTAQRIKLAAADQVVAAAEMNLAKAQASASTMAATGATALNGLKAAGASALAFFGGPWGLAFTTAAGAVAYLATYESDAEKITKQYSATITGLTGTVDEATAAMNAMATSVRSMSAEKAKAALAETQQEMQKLWASLRNEAEKKDFGGGFLRGIMQSELAQVGQTIDALGKGPLADLVQRLEAGDIKAGEFRDAMYAAFNAGDLDKGTRDVLIGVATAIEAAAAKAGLLHEQIDKAGPAAANAAAGADKLAEALKKVADKQGITSAESAITFLTQLTDGSVAAKEAARQLKQAKAEEAVQFLNSAAAANEYAASVALAGVEDAAMAGNAALVKSLEARSAALKKSAQEARELAQKGQDALNDPKFDWGGMAEAASKIENAKRALQGITAEIEKLNGTGEGFGEQLTKKLADIAKTGKDAGLSLKTITELQEKYSAAANADNQRKFTEAIRDMDLALAEANGEMERAQQIRYDKYVEDQTKKMSAFEKVTEETADKIRQVAKAQADAAKIKDAAAAAQFYKDLYEMAGQFGAAQEYNNELLRIQGENFRKNVGISQELVDQWIKLKKLENDRSPEAGITRAFQKYAAEAANLGKQTEKIFTDLLSGIDSSMKSMWDQLLDKGKISLDSFKNLFKSFLADLLHMAITKPIMLSVVGGFSGGDMGMGGGSGGGLLGSAVKWLTGGGSSSSDYGQQLADYTTNLEFFKETGTWLEGMPTSEPVAGGLGSLLGGNNTGSLFSTAGKLLSPSTWTSAWDKLSSGYDYIQSAATKGFDYIGSLFSSSAAGGSGSVAGGTFTSTAINEMGQAIGPTVTHAAAPIGEAASTFTNVASETATTWAGVASEIGTATAALNTAASVFGMIGGGFTGYQLGSWAAGSIMGKDKMGTKGAQDGAKIGAGLGAAAGIAGAAIYMGGVSAMMAGMAAGSVVPGIGTLIGAAVGAIAGALMGAGDVRKPTMRADVQGRLGYEPGEAGPYTGLDFSNNAVMEQYFGKTFARWERERPGAQGGRTFVHQNDYAIVGTSGEHLGGGSGSVKNMIDAMGELYLTAMEEANKYALNTGVLLNSVGNISTVLRDDYTYNTDEWQSYDLGDKWLEALRQIDVHYDGKQTGSRLSQKGIDKMLEGLTGEIEGAYQQAFAALDLSAIADRFTVDQSSYEGLQRFLEAIVVTQDVLARTDSMYQPTTVTQVQEQVAEAMKATDEWKTKMAEVGVVQDYADRLVEDFLYGTLQKFIGEVDKGVNPLAELTQEIEKINAQFEDLRLGAQMLGATTEDLFRIEMLRAASIRQMEHSMKDPFYDNLRLEAMSLAGMDTDWEKLMQSQRGDRLSTEKKFGTDSPEYDALLKVQDAQRLALEASKAQQALTNTSQAMDQLTQAADQAASAASAAYVALVDGIRSALETARNGIKQAVDAWVNATKSAYETAAKSYLSALESEQAAYKSLADRLSQTRTALWTDSSLNPQDTVYGSAKAEMDSLYAAAKSGDKDAASKLADMAKTFLNSSYAVQGDYSDYIHDFDSVQAMLDGLETEAQRQADTLQSEIDLLQQQLGAQDKTNKTLAELKDAMNASYTEYQRAAQEQADAYAKWGFETTANLEQQYRDAVTQWMEVQAFMNQAMLEGLIAQDQMSTLSIVGKLEELKAAYISAAAASAAAQAQAAAAAAGQAAANSALADALAKQQAAADKAKDALDIIDQHKPQDAGGIYGSKYKSEYDLLQAKAQAMNTTQKEGWQASPDHVAFMQERGVETWTSSLVYEFMKNVAGLTLQDWYLLYGKPEGFAAGGVATPGLALVGEHGPELVNFSSRAMVYPAADTARLLDRPAAGTDGSPAADRAMIQELQEQNDLLRAILARMTNVDKNTKNSADSLDVLAGDSVETGGGIPPLMEWA